MCGAKSHVRFTFNSDRKKRTSNEALRGTHAALKWYRELEALAVFLKWRVALLTGNRRAKRDPCESTRRSCISGRL
jgi:hypothetical protein